MSKLTKSQKQLILLGVVLAAILVVLAIFIFKPPALLQEVFAPKTIDTRIPDDVLKAPEYRHLIMPVELPLVPGPTGRPNPFAPY